ncbi:tetratricopeptide repeat protein [Cerasicoccus frondis]|uniref:tetratricopeptide repeat protein n=1 Tax=Cerasicoccus frondis TaxID=490090 RepID=UPI0028527D9E|nr:hypothetical protein [Cerasicoccus frondis]
MPKLVIRAIVLATVLAAGGVVLWLWREHALARMQLQTEQDLASAWENRDFERVRLLAEHLPDEASRGEWLAQLSEAQLAQAVGRGDAYAVRQLRNSQLEAPESESEALLLARVAIHERNAKTYTEIRERWESDRDASAAWIFLEVDALIVSGKIEEARSLLEQNQFTGQHESNRLLRLALLSTTDPREVLRQIDEAVRAAPDHAEALAFRGQILESLGQWQAARADYVRALALEADSPLFWDQLGEFYRRREQYALAVDTWSDGFVRTQVPEFWIKAWFWRRVAGLGQSILEPPMEGPFVAYAHYLANLPDDVWWNSESFDSLPYASRILQQRQETFWLRLLQVLKEGDETQALMLLRSDPFAKRSWAPQLKSALTVVLLWRSSEPVMAERALADTSNHQFYQQLTKMPDDEVTPGLERLLNERTAWAACFLAEGWLRAAVNFDQIESGQPEWYGYGQAQAQRQLQSVSAALARLESVGEEPTTQLLRADLLWLSDQPTEAVALWESLLTSSDAAAAERAATLLSVYYATENDWAKVQALVEQQPQWAKSTVGSEMRARLALSRGNLAQASAIYESIQEDSMDAKLFLSRMAYQEENWQRARELTQALILENPDEPSFYRNLNAIAQAEAKP